MIVKWLITNNVSFDNLITVKKFDRHLRLIVFPVFPLTRICEWCFFTTYYCDACIMVTFYVHHSFYICLLKFCCKDELSLAFIYLFIQFVSLWTHEYLFYPLDFHPLLWLFFYFFIFIFCSIHSRFGHWEYLQVDSCVLYHAPVIFWALFYFLTG